MRPERLRHLDRQRRPTVPQSRSRTRTTLPPTPGTNERNNENLNPLPSADAAGFHNAQLAALAMVEASIDGRAEDLVTVAEPHLARPYWLINALLSLCNSLLLGYPDPQNTFDQLRAALLTNPTEGEARE